jgi:uncharacterized membrane protein
VADQPRNGKRAFLVSLKALALIAMCVISGVIGGALTNNFGHSTYTLSYADFISVMLTAIAVLMTVLAIFLGILGVIGWNSVANKVESRTEDFLIDGFKKGEPLYLMLRARVTEAMYEGVRPVSAEDEAEDTDMASADQQVDR